MLAEKLQKLHIILSSGSPRRQNFFKQLGLDFTIDVRPIDETYSAALKKEQITDYLAKQKATPFTDLQENEVLVTSDTIVWYNDKAIEKAHNRDEAIAMLTELSGTCHEVYTSVCFTTKTTQKVVNDLTKVWFKQLSLEEITYYIDVYKPFDKAGSYGIQDWLGYIGVTKIEGSFFNVMGLPTHLVYQELLAICTD
ncbi:MAG: Maf family nucleotide pyrophosphatase [Gilvibacter sp.]